MPDLTLLDFPADPQTDGWETFSPFVLQVSRALKLAKLPFTHKRISLTKIGSVSPVGQLPVLLVDGRTVADSTRIMREIELLAPGVLLKGLDERGRAESWLWEEFGETALYPYVLVARWVDDRDWPGQRAAFFSSFPQPLRAIISGAVRRKISKNLVERDFLRAGLEPCYARLERTLDSLELRAPESGFWVGEHATVGDLGLFAHLHALRLPRTVFTAELVKQRPRLSRYLDRVHAATQS